MKGFEEEVISEEEIKEIKGALEEIKKGKVYSITEVADEFEIKLS